MDGFAGPGPRAEHASSSVCFRPSFSARAARASPFTTEESPDCFSSIATSTLISSSRRRTRSASLSISDAFSFSFAAFVTPSARTAVAAPAFSPTREVRARSRNTLSAARILSMDPPRSGSSFSSSQNRSMSLRSLASSLSESASRPSTSPRASLSSARSALFSSRSLLITSLGSVSSFTSSAFRTEAMRSANRHVDMPSKTCSNSGLIVATIAVAQFPPSESFSSMVITLSRYGTWGSPSLSATTTFSSACRDRLMCFASRSALPLTPVLPTRSDPARSTRWILPRRTVSEPATRRSTDIVNTQCERLDCKFIGVSATARLTSPRNSRLSASSSEPARCAEHPRAWITPSSSSNNATLGKNASVSDDVFSIFSFTPFAAFFPPSASAPSQSRSYAWSLYTSTYDTVTS